MEKREILAAFDGKFSPRSVQWKDGAWRIHGKYVDIEPLPDGNWDVYVHNRENPAEGLGNRRVKHILNLFSRQGARPHPMDGEGYVRSTLEQIKPVALAHRAFLGIPKKVEYTPESLAERRKRMEKFNDV